MNHSFWHYSLIVSSADCIKELIFPFWSQSKKFQRDKTDLAWLKYTQGGHEELQKGLPGARCTMIKHPIATKSVHHTGKWYFRCWGYCRRHQADTILWCCTVRTASRSLGCRCRTILSHSSFTNRCKQQRVASAARVSHILMTITHLITKAAGSRKNSWSPRVDSQCNHWHLLRAYNSRTTVWSHIE